MTTILVCLCQLTLVALVAISAAYLLLSRAPRLAASICWLGIFLSSSLVVATYVDAPRPWSLSGSSAIVDTPAEDSNRHASEASIQATHLSAQIPLAGFSLNAMLRDLTQFRTRHAEFESTLARGCSLGAMAICVLVLGRCFVGVVWLLRLGHAQEIASHATVYHELNALVVASGLKSRVTLRESAALSSPCVSWISRGTIYVPPGFEQWTPVERGVALAHELAHEVRCDPQWRFMAELCLSLVCFHPLMHVLRRQLIFSQELATDQRAASLLGSLNQYRRGLTLLALRMDSQRTASCLVSVSTNDVVRRIRMLSVTKPSLRRWQEVSAVIAVVFSSLFVAAWTAQADDVVRVASREKAGVPKSAAPTPRPPLQPWEELGEQDGYLVLRPEELTRHPLFASLYQNWVEPRLKEYDLTATGLAPENISSMQLPLTVQLSKAAEGEASDGNKHRLFADCNGIVLQASRPIGWKKVAEQLPPLPGQAEATEWLKSELTKSDQQSALRLLSTEAENRRIENVEKLYAVWRQACRGSSLAAACLIPEGFGEEIEDDTDVVGARELLAAVDATAIAVGFDADSGAVQIDLVFAAADGSGAELAKLAGATRTRLIDVGRTAAKVAFAGADNRAKLECVSQILDDLNAASIESVAGSELVVVHVKTKADLATLLQ